jgi:hypothetical protein
MQAYLTTLVMYTVIEKEMYFFYAKDLTSFNYLYRFLAA